MLDKSCVEKKMATKKVTVFQLQGLNVLTSSWCEKKLKINDVVIRVREIQSSTGDYERSL